MRINTPFIQPSVYSLEWLRSAAASKHNVTTSNKPSSNHRSASTRQSSRAGPSRATSMIIRGMDEKDGKSKRHGHADNGGTDLQERSIPVPSRHQLSSAAAPPIRAPKAKELQRRLGVGKPIAAGGAGPRTVTRSTTLSKGKQTKPGRALKAEATIPEEGKQRRGYNCDPTTFLLRNRSGTIYRHRFTG